MLPRRVLLPRRARSTWRRGIWLNAIGPVLLLAATQGCAKDAALPGNSDPSRSDESSADDNADDESPDADSGAPLSDDTEGNEPSDPVPPDALPVYTNSARVGERGVTQVYDIESHLTPDAAATLRAESDRTVVYVQDALYPSLIDDDQLNRFVARFEVLGNPESHDPSLGVLALDEAVFSPLVTTLYAGGKLSVFIVDTHGSADGYICSWCDEPSLHLDGKVLAPIDEDLALSISSHELYHAIHRGYDADETIWIDESMAEAAMVVNGFLTDIDPFTQYLMQPNVAWGPSITQIGDFKYGAGLSFGTYLWEQGGVPLMQAVTREPANGWQGLDNALVSVADGRSGFDLFMEMGLALYFDAPERGFGFESFLVPGQVPTRTLASGTTEDVNLAAYGLVYLEADATTTALTVDATDDVVAIYATDTDPISVTRAINGAQLAVTEPGVLVLSATRQAGASVSAR